MRELGEQSDALHAGLAPAVVEAKVDELILIGPEMEPLAEAIGASATVQRAATVEDACAKLLAMLRPGDAVLVKASNSVGLAALVDRVTRGR